MVSDSPSALSRPRIRWQSLAWQAIAGFVLGFILLHSAAAGVICQWLDPRIPAAASYGKPRDLLALITGPFQPEMLGMGLAYGVIGALIATSFGYFRLILAAQRDQLAEKSLERTPFTQLANLCGLPAMTVPLYWTPDGLPSGSQFMAPFGDEATLFRLAGQLEKAQPWFDKRPPFLAA